MFNLRTFWKVTTFNHFFYLQKKLSLEQSGHQMSRKYHCKLKMTKKEISMIFSLWDSIFKSIGTKNFLLNSNKSISSSFSV